MGQTETRLAKFVMDFPTDDIPSDVMHLAKRCLINYAGVSLYATLDPAIDILLDLLRAEGCLPAATIIAKGLEPLPKTRPWRMVFWVISRTTTTRIRP